MASRRGLRRRCSAKAAYAGKDAAVAALFRLEAQGRDGLHPYRCPHCRRWHLGHHPARVWREIEARP